jgi:hypothetical protein
MKTSYQRLAFEVAHSEKHYLRVPFFIGRLFHIQKPDYMRFYLLKELDL